MPVEEFLSLQASVARPGESDSDEDMDEDTEFIEDDETLEATSSPSGSHRLFLEDNESSEDPEQIAANIKARHAQSRLVHRESDDDAIRQLDAQMYSFSVPEFKVKQLEAQLLALKVSTSAAPLLEHVITAPHLPRHIFVLASPTTIAEVVRQFSLPLPRAIPREEWGNSLDSVPWTQHRRYPLGSFVKILESGTYRGDLGYVLAMDFKDDHSIILPQPQSNIFSTPQSVIVAVVPRIRHAPSGKRRGPIDDDDARTLMIVEQIKQSFQAESARLEEVVEAMREQARIAGLRKDLMKEKDDLVLRHGQLRREVEKEIADVAACRTKSKQDLEKERRRASGLRIASIRQEMECLLNETLSTQQQLSEKLAAASSTYESQLSSIKSKIDLIPEPPNIKRSQRPKSALFDHESVERASPGSCHHFTYTGNDIFEFSNDLTDCFARPAIVTHPETHQPTVGANFLTFWSLDTMLSSQEGERIYIYQGRPFLRGLELVPIHDNRALEVAHPTVEDLEPFIQSRFDSPRIDRLFSALHWHRGDKLIYWDDDISWYYLREIIWKAQLVIARKINPFFGDPNLDNHTSGLNDVQLHLRWTKRAFKIGDSVEVTFGPHKGMSGTLTVVTDETVTLLTVNLMDLTVSRDFIRTCITISTSATELDVGDLVDVIAGRYHRESGTIVRQYNGLLTIRSTNNINLEMVVPVDAVQKVLAHLDLAHGDVSPHIALRSLVRVLRGPYQRCQGVVSEKFNHGRELVIMDPDNNESFMVSEDEVQTIRIFQDPSRASMTLPRPWTSIIEAPAVGDFIRVIKGSNRGEEGCIEVLGTNLNEEYTIAVTSAEFTIPTVVVESDENIKPPTTTSTIFALPIDVCIYKSIQKFDIVRVLGGLFTDAVGCVDEIYHGTGWYIVTTPSHRLRLYRTNIELQDRLCVDDFVRVTAHGPFLGRQGTIRKVNVEGNIEIITLPSGRIVHFLANQVEREIEGQGTFSLAKRDPAIGKRVRVIKGPMKGSAGYVVAKNYVKDYFVVGLELSGMKMNFDVEQLVYFDSRVSLHETPVVNSPPSGTLSEPLPERGQTPSPDFSEEGWTLDDHTTFHSSFLNRGIWSAASGKHIRVVTGADKRNGFTTNPIQFDDPLCPSSVMLYFTNAHGQWKKEYLPLATVSPSPPNSRDQLAMILKGTYEGRIFNTVKVSRKHRTATFNSEGKKWEETWDVLCMVEDHKLSGCNCEKAN